MTKKTYTEWRAEIDSFAIQAKLAEPGASFSKRHDAQFWRDSYDRGAMPAEAWEEYMEADNA